MNIKSIPPSIMPKYLNALDDMRTLSKKAASSNPIWICACAHRAGDVIQELLNLVASLEGSEADLVAQLKARPYKTK